MPRRRPKQSVSARGSPTPTQRSTARGDAVRRSRTAAAANIHDVAKLAGVSPMTVSRVVNGARGVAAATRERVQQAVSSLGFVPSSAARSLRAGRSHWIALVFQRSLARITGDPAYVTELQDGVIRRCQENGYHVAVELLAAETGAACAQLRELAQQLAPDGVLLAPPASSSAALVRQLRELQLPVVRIAPAAADGDTPCVLVDDRAAARQMTAYLLSMGHRRIGFIQGHPEHAASAPRLQGYLDALEDWSLPCESGLVVPGDFTFDGGRRAASALLGLGPRRPGAIFASNDELAAGCLYEAHRRGLAVPGQLSVAGFDDTYVASMLYPPLTTIRQSIRETGHAAMGQLLALMAGAEVPPALRIAHQLVERRSAAAPCMVQTGQATPAS